MDFQNKKVIPADHGTKELVQEKNIFEAIIRHEFGHALGLGHSTAQEDLMHAILPDYPYISSCDIGALKGLYDGDKNSKVVCKK